MQNITLEYIVSLFSASYDAIFKELSTICNEHTATLSSFSQKILHGKFKSYYGVQNIIDEILKSNTYSPREKELLIKGMICYVVIENANSGEYKKITNNIYAQFIDRLHIVFKNVENREQEYFIRCHDRLLKDVGVATKKLISCRLLLFDLTAIPRRYILSSPKLILFLVTMGGYTNILEDHLDDEYLAEFSEKGWEHSHLLLAEYLQAHPSIRGMSAKSWFYDPELKRVTPHLTFLADMRLQNGAKRFKMETSQSDFSNALAKSKSRRALWEKGQYTPQGYMLLWPAKDVISWAKKVVTKHEQAQA